MEFLSSEESLFRDMEIFNPDYTPEDFLYRDGQIKILSLCVKPALKKGRPLNAAIVGPPATGKTTSVKHIFSQVPENKAYCVHINCYLHKTQYNILAEIHKKVLGYRPPDTGITPSTLHEKIFSKMAKEKKSLIVALDDVHILQQKDLDEIAYSILRAHEGYEVTTALWLISTRISFHTMDERVRSILQPQLIQFNPYKKDEVSQILKNRIELGLNNVLTEQLKNLIIDNAHDLRHGIELIKTSALIAESELKKEISKEHVEKAIQNLEINDAGDFFQIIKENSPIESGDLYEKIKVKLDISYSTFYRYVKKLEREGKVKLTLLEKSSKNSSSLGLQNSEAILKEKGRTTLVEIV